jgi:glucans biosynthesis protein C
MKRVWFVDNLRTALIVLVVLHHVACIYSGLDAWYYTEKPDSGPAGLVLTVFLLVNQAWFMGAFFLLSGLFTPASYDRKGPRAFVRDRLIRLGIPLAVFYFLLNPVLDHGRIGSGPLWFVLALLVFDLSYVFVRRFRERREAAPKPLTYRAVAVFVAALAITTYILRIVVPLGTWVPVIDFPTSAYLPEYVSFFVVGVLAARRGWLTSVTDRMGRAGAALAAGATIVFLPLALAGGLDQWMGHGTLGSLFYALWDSSFAVGVVLALVTLFRRHFDTRGRFRRYLSDHVFTVYVTHAFLVTLFGYALSTVPIPTTAKVAIGFALVVPACFALAGPIRRLPAVRRVL